MAAAEVTVQSRSSCCSRRQADSGLDLLPSLSFFMPLPLPILFLSAHTQLASFSLSFSVASSIHIYPHLFLWSSKAWCWHDNQTTQNPPGVLLTCGWWWWCSGTKRRGPWSWNADFMLRARVNLLLQIALFTTDITQLRIMCSRCVHPLDCITNFIYHFI